METFSWDIRLPERSTSSLGKRKPCATLLLTSHCGEEQIDVPLAVGILLLKQKDANEFEPVSRAELLYVLKNLEARLAARRIATLLDRRDYSEQEAREKLRADGYPSQAIDDSISHAADVGLIDNFRFADAYIRAKISAGWGSRKISYALFSKGICAEDLPGWPNEYFSAEGDAERAYSLVSRKRVASKNPYAALMRFLQARGFSYSVADTAVRRRLQDMSDSSD